MIPTRIPTRRTVPDRGPDRGPNQGPRPSRSIIGLGLLIVLALAACGGGTSSTGSVTASEPVLIDGELPRFPDGTRLRVLAHDSFAMDTAVLEEFSERTGVEVEILTQGDAGVMVNAAILTSGDPQGDLLFGIDETLLAPAFDADLFQPFHAEGLTGVGSQYRIDDAHRVTPIDHGEVCVNFDRAWFEERSMSVPQRLEDLAGARAKSLLTVQDPTASTPGSAFLLATIARFGGGDDPGPSAAWLDYWRALRDNDVSVVDSWETAYYSSFSGASGEGSRPLVVSYSSSPPAEVVDTSVAVDATPTGVIADTCFRQIEFAGVLRGAAQPRAAQAFIEFMLEPRFQQQLPGQMYVYPVVEGTPLPDVFATYSTPIPDPLSLPYTEIATNRERWIEQWASVFR